jgi:hypothetical protein
VPITNTTTLAELRDELERLGVVQIGVRPRIAKSTVSILGAARVGIGDYRTFEANGGTIGEALAAACAKVAAIREEIAEAGFLAKPHHALLVKDTAIVGCTCGLRFTAEDEAARHQAAVAPKEP